MAILKKILINFWGLEREYLTEFYFFEKKHQMEKNGLKKKVVHIYIFLKCPFLFLFCFIISGGYLPVLSEYLVFSVKIKGLV